MLEREHIAVYEIQVAAFFGGDLIKIFELADIVGAHPAILSANGITIHTALIIATEQPIHIELDKILCFFIR